MISASGMFLRYVACEWIKRRRSLGSWVVMMGALFTPTVVLVARIVHRHTLPALYATEDFWRSLWRSSWESMAVFFAPMGAILITSLVVQIEYRSNAWKQVRTLPLPSLTLYAGKLIVILAMVVQLFALFYVGVILSAAIPCWLGLAAWPQAVLPAYTFLNDTGRYFISCLPIVAVQYVLSVHFKNFLVPIGAGFMAWVGALAALSWKFGYLIPYSYSMMRYLNLAPKGRVPPAPVSLDWLAAAYAIGFAVLGYGLFVRRDVKG